MLALDIDGTLMDSRGRFPEINCRELQRCEKSGMRIALVSGRSFEVMRLFARELGIHPLMAACNGARLEAGENGPTLAEFTFERSAAEQVARVLEQSGLYFNCYRRGKNYMGNPAAREALGGRYAHHLPGVCGEAPYLYETVCDAERLHGEGMDGVYKFVAMGGESDPRFGELERALAPLRLSVSSASPHNIEFMPTGVDKGSAVRRLARYAGVDTAQIMAFGDQTNDLPMLAACGFPVAMENGDERVRRAARLIAPDHDLGGVGRVLEKYLPD